MSTFRFDKLSIDAVAYGSQGSAILGIRDSGKTYTATLFAEHLFDADIPFVAFDPIGVWRFLRVPGQGVGYPIVVAGGQEGDLPLTVAGAPEIVRAAVANGVSLVIDLFDIKLTKADWKRIVTACVRVLLHENGPHGLRHIFIEEAAEFCPQRVGSDQGQVYAEIEKLARMGGNARLGYTLINQRAEEVNKAVLELCDNLFLHRQKGRNSLTALSKWLDIGAVKDHREIISTLATLPTGECWAWLAGTDRPVHVKVPAKDSLHPDRRIMRGDKGIVVKPAVDVGAFVASMRGSLVKVEEEAKANDPKALRARIADLENQLAAHRPDPKAIEEAELRGHEKGFRAGNAIYRQIVDGIEQWAAAVAATVEKMRAARDAAIERLQSIQQSGSPTASTTVAAPRRAPGPALAPPKPSPAGSGGGYHVAPRPAPVDGVRPLAAESRPLAVLAGVHPAGMTEAQWAVGSAIRRKGGTWRTYKSRLVMAGRVEQRDGLWYATDQGLQDLGGAPTQMPPPGPELLSFWASKVGGAAPMLRFLAEQYPQFITRSDLAQALDVEESGGTFRTYLSKLRTPGLIEEDDSKNVRAAPSLMVVVA
jgi:hypothetical protein